MEDAVLMFANCFGNLNDGGCPEVPLVEEGFGVVGGLIARVLESMAWLGEVLPKDKQEGGTTIGRRGHSNLLRCQPGNDQFQNAGRGENGVSARRSLRLPQHGKSKKSGLWICAAIWCV